MPKDYEGRLEATREHIATADDLTDRDRELLLDFADELALRPSDFAVPTRYKLLQYCMLMAGHSPQLDAAELPDGELAPVLEDRERAEAIVRWIHDRYDNEESNAAFRRALRTFGRVMTDGDEVPDALAWIPTTMTSTYDPAPKPANMLTWDDILTLADHTYNTRDAALLAVGWDSGARGEELTTLSRGDVTDHDLGMQITVSGKQGQRTVTLIPSVPFLQTWLVDHPGGRDDPLWCRLDRPEGVTYETLWKAVTRAGERAGIDKPCNFTNLRKSSASYLASQGMSQAHLEDHHGWVRGSDVAARYVAIFGDAADRELAAIHGVETDADEPEPVGPIECPRCGKDTPRERPACIHCQQSLDREVRNAISELREFLDERTIEADDPEEAGKLVEARRNVEANPDGVDLGEVHDLLASWKD